MRKLLIILLLVSTAFYLGGCGSRGGGSDSSDTLADTGTTTNLEESAGSPASIALGTSLPAFTVLSQGGETTVTALVKDADGNTVDNGTVVQFTASQGSIPASATTVDGVASAAFKAGASGGIVTITAAVDDGTGTFITKQISIEVATGDAASIVLASVTPEQIGVIGSGISQVAVMKFQVLDTTDNPVPDGTVVEFSLTSSLGGGESISVDSDQTTGGAVSVALLSGRVSGTATVTASVTLETGTVVSTEGRVTIVAGKPDQEHFGLAVGTKNFSGWDTFGLEDKITAFLGDRFSNPVPAETPISFFTEGGLVSVKDASGEPTNLTSIDGQATATLISANPLPSTISTLTGLPGASTILAVTNGEESFTDSNGNGLYDSGEPFEDRGEPFIDKNDSSTFDSDEFFVDVDENGSYTEGNGVRDSSTVIWTTHQVMFSASNTAPKLTLTPNPFAIGDDGSQSFDLSITDVNGNPLVPGTSVSISASTGELVGNTDFTLADATIPGLGATDFSFTLRDNSPGDTDPAENVEITVTVDIEGTTWTAFASGTID